MSIGIDSAQSFMSVVTTTATTGVPAAKVDGLGHSLSVQNFEDSLRAASGPEMPVLQLAQADPTTTVPGATATDLTTPLLSAPGTPPVGEVVPSVEADARLRAAEGLGLGESETVGPGNSILNGLEQLRTVFDSQYNSVGSKLQGTTLDVTAMMSLQADIVQYSVLVDVSSKLAGKVTTAVDSLMKGQ
jgi:type III secretion system YscI/HrpB-like protein